MSIRLAERAVGAVPLEVLPSEVLAVFARFEALSDVSLHTGECVDVDKIQRGVQTDSNPGGQWIAGVLDRPSALIVPLRGLDLKASHEKPLVFHLNNKAFPRWYYDWESGANKAQRLMKHKLIAYVMERVAVDTNGKFTTWSSPEARTQLYRVVHVMSSAEFTVISYRRAPLETLQMDKASEMRLSKEPNEQIGVGELISPKIPETTHQVYQSGPHSPTNDVDTVPPVSKRDDLAWKFDHSSPNGNVFNSEAKRRRRVACTRSRDAGNGHPLCDQMFWAHTNAPVVAVSKNIALLFAFVSWVPLRLYASFVEELVELVKLKILDPLAIFKKDTEKDAFARLLLQHARSGGISRADGDPTLSLELELLLRVAFQSVLWLSSQETRRWMRDFFCLNATLVLDKKAMRRCFIQFLREFEEHINAEVLATSTFRNLSNVTDQVITAVYSNECFYDRRPQVRQILSGHSFAGWTMFVAQLRDTYIDATSLPVYLLYPEREITFKTAFPPHCALECDLNGEWLLDMNDTQWEINESSLSPTREMIAEGGMPHISFFSLVEFITQIIRFEIAVDIQESSLRLRAPQNLAGHLNCMHLVLDGKARVFRMLPNGMSSCASAGALGDYFGEMRVEEPSQVIILMEIFNWSLEEGLPSYHVRTCLEFHTNGRLTVGGDILATTGLGSFTAEEILYVGEMTLLAKRKVVENASARRRHAVSTPRDTPLHSWEEYGRFRLCYHKLCDKLSYSEEK